MKIRLYLMYANSASKTPFDRNEIRIQEIETQIELAKTLKNIEQLEGNLKNNAYEG